MNISRCPWALTALSVALTVAACGTAAPPGAPSSDGPLPVAEGSWSGASGHGPGVGAPSPSPASSPQPPPPDDDRAADVSPDVLAAALDREYYAGVLYDRVLTDLGPVSPFDTVSESEDQHQATVAALFSKRGWTVPPNPYAIGQMPAFASVAAACRHAAGNEEEVAATYQALLAAALPKDVRTVFGNMLAATVDHHLAAFERCAASR